MKPPGRKGAPRSEYPCDQTISHRMPMRIEITGKKLDVGDALRERLTEKLTDVVGKFTFRPTEARITLAKDSHFFVCDCKAHLSTGLTVQATAKDNEIFAACDIAIAKLEKQLRRHKRRLRDHHQRRAEPVEFAPATDYVLRSEPDADPETGASEAEFDDMAAPAEDNAATSWKPVIIAEKPTAIPSLSVGEAVMQMELSGAPFLLFQNDAQSRLNVVYLRDDGTIGWIDPS